MRVTFSSALSRPKPRVGDRKVIGGVEHVRVLQRVKSGPHEGAYVINHGRPCYEWEPVEGKENGHC